MQEKEYKITHGLTVVANGPNSVQVTVPSATRSMIFLVKFKSVSSAEEFLMKVNNQPGESKKRAEATAAAYLLEREGGREEGREGGREGRERERERERERGREGASSMSPRWGGEGVLGV